MSDTCVWRRCHPQRHTAIRRRLYSSIRRGRCTMSIWRCSWPHKWRCLGSICRASRADLSTRASHGPQSLLFIKGRRPHARERPRRRCCCPRSLRALCELGAVPTLTVTARITIRALGRRRPWTLPKTCGRHGLLKNGGLASSKPFEFELSFRLLPLVLLSSQNFLLGSHVVEMAKDGGSCESLPFSLLACRRPGKRKRE